MADSTFGDIIQFPNACLQVDEAALLITRSRRMDGTGKIGQIVKKGTDADEVAAAGAGEEAAIGFVYAAWNSNGQKLVVPGTAIADNDLVEVAYFQSGVPFVGLLPNTVATTVGERLKCAAAGRVTNLTGTATADELLAARVRALQALTAAADDTLVLLGCC